MKPLLPFLLSNLKGLSLLLMLKISVSLMKVGLVGKGNVATALVHNLQLVGCEVAQIMLRDKSSFSPFPAIETIYTGDQFDTTIDVILVCVNDDAIQTIGQQLSLQEHQVIAHTSGSVPSTDLEAAGQHFGVFYPLQSFKKTATYHFEEIPICLTANDDFGLQKLRQLAQKLSKNLYEMNDEQRRHVHLAAIMVNNFVNHLLVLARDYLADQQVDMKILLPLIEETLGRVKQEPMLLTQTGPAIRNDTKVIEKHQALLRNTPLLEVYNTLTNSILEKYHPKNTLL